MHITEREQHLLFDEYNTPLHVQRHCNEVARVAGILAEALDRQADRLIEEGGRKKEQIYQKVGSACH